MMAFENLINDILHGVDTVTVDFVKNGFQQISYYWLSTGLLGSVFTVYTLLYLYQMKYQDLPISEGATRILKFCLVFVLVTDWEVFYTLIFRVFTDEPLAIAGKLLPNQTSENAINQFFATGMSQAAALMSNLPMSLKGVIIRILSGALVIVATCLFFLYAIGLIIISKFYLAVLLAIAPYFLLAQLFDATKGLTQTWIKSCLNYGLVPIFVGAIMLLATKLASNFLHPGAALGANPENLMSFEQMMGYLFCSIICLYLFKTVPEKAASLTASLAMAGAGKMLNHAKSQKDNVVRSVRNARQEASRRQYSLMRDVRQRNAAPKKGA